MVKNGTRLQSQVDDTRRAGRFETDDAWRGLSQRQCAQGDADQRHGHR